MDTNTNGKQVYTLHLFAGAGGGILADLLLGHIPVGAVEIEAYPRKVLLARQLDGSLPRFPIWDDVCTFRADNTDTSAFIERLKGIREQLCICGGFPCQDLSCAGKGAGIDGARSGLWREFARIICEIRPRFAFVENSPMLTIRGFGRVLGDLAEMGYDAKWGVLGAGTVGLPHNRGRIWIMANCYQGTFRQLEQRKIKVIRKWRTSQWSKSRVNFLVGDDRKTPSFKWQGKQETDTEPVMRRDVDGMGKQLDRIAAVGNGQCPQVAALAWTILSDGQKDACNV